MFKSKIKASLIHLGLSILLVSLIMGSLLFFFFPSLFINVTDFKEVAILIISIDLVLGPLLTFVVFQPKKKSLKFDLAIIGAIQLSALFYGTYALYQVHPVYVAFNIDRFTLVSARDAEPEKAKYDSFKVSKTTAGKLVFAKMPEDIKKQNELILSASKGGEDLDKREEYYEPIENYLENILAKSLDPDIIFSTQEAKDKASNFLSKYQKQLHSFAYLPLNSEKKNAIIVLNRKTAEPVTTINIDPWQLSKK